MVKKLNKISGLIEDPEREKELEERGFYSEPHLRELGKARQLDRIERMLKWIIMRDLWERRGKTFVADDDYELGDLPDISDLVKGE